MPRFYFNVTVDDDTTVDEDGQDLSSPKQAHDEAVKAIWEIAADTATTTRSHAVQVAVCDAEHQVICTTSVSFDPGHLDE